MAERCRNDYLKLIVEMFRRIETGRPALLGRR
jgi:hypothetical protein